MKWILILILGFYTAGRGQNKMQISFYNLENLFDTINDPITWDDERTPNGNYHYNSKVYYQKLENTAKVLSDMIQHEKTTPFGFVGLAELENRNVLQDLLNHKKLKSFKLRIIHRDSPDKRGIDVALVYNPKVFKPIDFRSHEVKVWSDRAQRIYTRDILEVKGIFYNKMTYVFVNHWPSRRGGKSKSERLRISASQTLKKRIIEIESNEQNSLIIAMGDFNDDPNDKSLHQLDSILFNPFLTIFKQGAHSLVYRDRGNLFDQILVNDKTLIKKSLIYNPSYLIQQKGKYKGYPFRSYAGQKYQGGYSDHYPVYLVIETKKQD